MGRRRSVRGRVGSAPVGSSRDTSARERQAHHFAVLALCGLLAGCTTADIPATLPIMSASYRVARPIPAPAPPIDWPRAFGSVELTALATQAEAGNLDIAAAVARILQAEATAKINASALYPQVNANGVTQRTRSPGTLRSSVPPFPATQQNLFSLIGSASYVIDFWGRNQATAESGRISAEASRFDRDVVALTTLATLANTYFQVLDAEDRRHIAQENVRISERVLKAIRERLTVGTATALDVAQQESVVATQRALVPPLDQTIQQNKNAIAVLLGRTPESVSIRGGSLNRLVTPRIAPGLPSQLLLRRPDIGEAEAKLEAEQANIMAARAAFFPNVTLTGDAGLESIALKNLLRPEALTWQIAASVAQPIFTGYNLEGQVELAQGRYKELLEDYRKAILTALSDVENALIAVQQTSLHERLQAQVVASAQRAYHITEERLKEGTIDIVTLLNTETTLFQAQDQLSQIRLARFQAYVSLFQALGGGFELAVERERALRPDVKSLLNLVPPADGERP